MAFERHKQKRIFKKVHDCKRLQDDGSLAPKEGDAHMQKEIIEVIAENLDTIVNIYKMSKDRDRREIEEHIRSAIQNIKESERI
jgi:hypothetical protein